MLKILRFLDKADSYHGVFPHWLNGATGKTIPFGRKDDGADLVETSFLFQGLLCVRAYFDRDTPEELRLRQRTQLRRVESTHGGAREPAELHRREVTASLLSPVTSPPGRRSYLRGQLLRDRTSGEDLAQPLGIAGTHLLSSLAEANALIVLDEDTTEAGMDAAVRVAFLAPRQ